MRYKFLAGSVSVVQGFRNGLYFRACCVCNVNTWLSDKTENRLPEVESRMKTVLFIISARVFETVATTDIGVRLLKYDIYFIPSDICISNTLRTRNM